MRFQALALAGYMAQIVSISFENVIVPRQKTEIRYQMYAERSDYEARLVIGMENTGIWLVQVEKDLNRRIKI